MRVPLEERTAFNWHGYLLGVGPGQRYAWPRARPLRAEGGQALQCGQALVDPYAKAIEGPVRWDAANVYPYVPNGDEADLEPDGEDDAVAIPKCLVVDPSFDWEDRLPQTPWYDTVIYELHAKGFTKLHPGVREDLRGTYAGLASDAAIEYLTSLGVTAVELLPVHYIVDESFAGRGLTNYWGYATIGFLAPHALYAATDRRRAGARVQGDGQGVYRAGIEVILDVVYNHTAEGITSGRCSRSAASTTRRTTGSCRTTRATTWTSPAPATA